jgi:hypothetical protein
LLAGRNGDRAVPSFLALAWAVANGSRWSEVSVEGAVITAGSARLTLDAGGAALFLPEGAPAVVSMNELLVASEKFEREGGESPFRDHVMVLAPATADIARVAVDGAGAITPADRWASAWEAVRTNRLFLRPGWWYPFVVLAAGTVLVLGPARRSNGAAVLAGALRAAPTRGRTIAVIGMLADKDAAAFAAALDGCVDHWIVVSLPPPRGLEAAALARRLAPCVRAPIEEAGSVTLGCTRARVLARPGDRVVACGSFHAVGPALEWLGVYCGPRTD